MLRRSRRVTGSSRSLHPRFLKLRSTEVLCSTVFGETTFFSPSLRKFRAELVRGRDGGSSHGSTNLSWEEFSYFLPIRVAYLHHSAPPLKPAPLYFLMRALLLRKLLHRLAGKRRHFLWPVELHGGNSSSSPRRQVVFLLGLSYRYGCHCTLPVGA
jgi:hypothetical protein